MFPFSFYLDTMKLLLTTVLVILVVSGSMARPEEEVVGSTGLPRWMLAQRTWHKPLQKLFKFLTRVLTRVFLVVLRESFLSSINEEVYRRNYQPLITMTLLWLLFNYSKTETHHINRHFIYSR